MEKILLINGIIFCYLLFSDNLSGEKGVKDKKSNYIGLGIFFIFVIISSLLCYLENFELVNTTTWIALGITSIALTIKVMMNFIKNRP